MCIMLHHLSTSRSEKNWQGFLGSDWDSFKCEKVQSFLGNKKLKLVRLLTS